MTCLAAVAVVVLLLAVAWCVNVPRINNWLIRRRVMALMGIGKRRKR